MWLKNTLRNLFRRGRVDHELDEELHAYAQMVADEKMAQGAVATQARREANMELGGFEQVKERTREVRAGHFLETLWQDIRFGARMLRKSPAFTIVGVLTIALGIGANAAIFSMVDWLLLRPIPGVKDAHGLTYLGTEDKLGGMGNVFSYPNFEDIREQTTSIFSHLATIQPFQMDGLRADGKTMQIWTNYVSGDFFQMLGVRPAIGRLILPSEGRVPGADPVLVLSYSYWQTRFHGEPNVVGKKVTINGRPVTIIGVTEKGFHGALAILNTQGFLPLGMSVATLTQSHDFFTQRGNADTAGLFLIGRLKPGISLAMAQPALRIVARRLAGEYPQDDPWKSIDGYKFTAAPPGNDHSPVLTIMGALFLSLAGMVLLLACVNVANLSLVRAGIRSREMAVRAALGASRTRLMRQLLVESVLLALLGCAGGIVLGIGASHLLSSVPIGSAIPIVLDFSFNWHVFAYALIATLFTGVFVGMVPALRASRTNLNDVLHEGGRTSTRGRQRLRGALVVAQVAGSLVLLIVAGLFVRSLQTVQHMDLGFDPSNVLNLSMDPHEAGYDTARGAQFFHDLLARVQAMSGVASASIAGTVPMGLYGAGSDLKIPGYEPTKGEQHPSAGYNSVTPGYFQTMRIPVLQGRVFQESDTNHSLPVAIINEAMAKKFWPGENPIGRQFTIKESPAQTVQIVGIVKDSQTGDISEKIGPYFYRDFAQKYMTPATLQVRTQGPPDSMTRSLIGNIRSTEPAMPVFDVQTMRQALNTIDGLMLFQLGASLAASLGLLGLLLAVVGVYGVVSYAAGQRTHEIGIRMALGAQPGQILKMVLRQGLWIVCVGIAAGILLTLAISRVVSGFLVGVSGSDPLTYIALSLLLAAIALLASYIPARRAMRVDPMTALRYE